MSYLELFENLKNRTRMFISEKSYSCVTSFLIGYGCANQFVFEGFEEWLTYKYDAPNNFVFSQQIKFIFLNGDLSIDLSSDKETQLIEFLFRLFFEFDREKKDKGLEFILDNYEEYMRKQLE